MRIKLSDLEDFSVNGEWRAYSGRGMFCKEWLAFVCDEVGDYTATIMNLTEYYVEQESGYDDFVGGVADFYDYLSSVRTDSMGLRTVYYWPSVVVDDE